MEYEAIFLWGIYVRSFYRCPFWIWGGRIEFNVTRVRLYTGDVGVVLQAVFVSHVLLPKSLFLIQYNKRGVIYMLPILIYFLSFQIKPLVEPTQIIVDLPSVQYAWHDLVSQSEFHNILFLLLFMLTNEDA